MDRNGKRLSKADVVRILMCVVIGSILVAAFFSECSKSRREYQTSFQVGEQVGKVISTVEIKALKGEIEESDYVNFLAAVNTLSSDLTEENMEHFIEVARLLVETELDNHFELITDQDAYNDGVFVQSCDGRVLEASQCGLITEEQMQEIFALKEEASKNPSHENANQYIEKILDLLFFSSEEATK